LQVRAESFGGGGDWILYLKIKAITRIKMGVQFCKADESTTPARPRPTKYNVCCIKILAQRAVQFLLCRCQELKE
jgi:hypothetical protein